MRHFRERQCRGSWDADVEREVEMNLIFRFECPDERGHQLTSQERTLGEDKEREFVIYIGVSIPPRNPPFSRACRHPQDIRVCPPHIVQNSSLLSLTDGWLKKCFYGRGKCRHECRSSETRKERCGDFTVCCVQISKSKLFQLPPAKEWAKNGTKNGTYHVRLPA